MIRFVKGNLLEADTEALVNTVNTVGVMGKGVALMFKETFPRNFSLYNDACKRGEVVIGRMFVTENRELFGPHWIINFPTKQHWRYNSKMEWIVSGLHDLVNVIRNRKIRSIALPPLGCGNGGLNWYEVRSVIEEILGPLSDVDVIVYEPTHKYMTPEKREGVEELTPARALVVEMIRRYSVLELGCTNLEVHKLAWFLQRSCTELSMDNPLKLHFKADKFGPYADNLRHLLNRLDGSYLRSSRRMSDARPTDTIWVVRDYRRKLQEYLETKEFQKYNSVLELTTEIIDGFQSAFGMELLATIDWLMTQIKIHPDLRSVKEALSDWPGGRQSAERKLRIFTDRQIEIALERLKAVLQPVYA